MAKTKTTEASSLPELCLGAALRYGKADALNHRTEGKWHSISAEQFVERVKNVALGLAAVGIRPGDRIALLSENRPEWSIVDLAILSLGAINVPIYTTQAVDQIEYILSDSGAKAIFISNRRLYKHAQSALANRQLDHPDLFRSRDCGRRRSRDRPGPAGTERGRARRKRPGAFDAYLRIRPARRSRDDHLHVWHHGRAERRDVDAQQLHVERAVDREGVADRSNRRRVVGAAVVAHLRAYRFLCVLLLRRVCLLLRIVRSGRRELA